MAFESVVSTLENAFLVAWEINPTLDECPIEWDNLDFNSDRDMEDEQTEDNDPSEKWCRITVVQGDGDLLGHGAEVKLYRWVGIITVSVYTKEDIGSQSNKALCTLVRDIFINKQFAGNITCQVPQILEVGATNGWWQVNVNIPFYWDEFI